jgi:Tfp pilus assembly protein FimT
MIVDLVFMRTAAIEYGHPITMLSNDGNNWSNGWKIFIDKNKDSIVDVDEEVLRLNGNIGDGIIISANVSSFVYNNLGGIDGVLPEIDVSHDDSSYGVTLMVLRSGVTTSKEKS